MTTSESQQTVTLGPREWIALAALAVTLIGSGVGQLVRSESRFTSLETRLDDLIQEVNLLRTAGRSSPHRPLISSQHNRGREDRHGFGARYGLEQGTLRPLPVLFTSKAGDAPSSTASNQGLKRCRR